eukprot:3621597-Pyramimonas_sp.AAC.1
MVSEGTPSNVGESNNNSESVDCTSVWFFGYGATMNTNVMTNRQLNPLEKAPATLSNYRLVFDVGEMSA